MCKSGSSNTVYNNTKQRKRGVTIARKKNKEVRRDEQLMKNSFIFPRTTGLCLCWIKVMPWGNLRMKVVFRISPRIDALFSGLIPTILRNIS